jgi:hypothetical protein
VRRHRSRGPARFSRPAGTFARTTSSLNAAAAAGDLGAIRSALDTGAPVDGAPDDGIASPVGDSGHGPRSARFELDALAHAVDLEGAVARGERRRPTPPT